MESLIDQFAGVAQAMRNWTQTTGRRSIGQASPHLIATATLTFNSTLVVQRKEANRIVRYGTITGPYFECLMIS